MYLQGWRSSSQHGVPNDQSGWDDPLAPWQSPELRYANVSISVTTGDRVVNVWMREDGMRLDRILLTRSSTFPIAAWFNLFQSSFAFIAE